MDLSRIVRAATAVAALALGAETLQAQQAPCQLKKISPLEAKKHDDVYIARNNAIVRVHGDSVPLGTPNIYIVQSYCPAGSRITPPQGTRPRSTPRPAPRRSPTKPDTTRLRSSPVETFPEYTMELVTRGSKNMTYVINEHDRPVIPVDIDDRIHINGRGTRLRACRLFGLDADSRAFADARMYPHDTVIVFGRETQARTYNLNVQLKCEDTNTNGLVRSRAPINRQFTIQYTPPRRTPTTTPRPRKPSQAIELLHLRAGMLRNSQATTNASGGQSENSMSAPYVGAGIAYVDRFVSFEGALRSYKGTDVQVSESARTTSRTQTNVTDIDAFATAGYLLTAAVEHQQTKTKSTETTQREVPVPLTTVTRADAHSNSWAFGLGANLPLPDGRFIIAAMKGSQEEDTGRPGPAQTNFYVLRGSAYMHVPTPFGQRLPGSLTARLSKATGGAVPTSNEYRLNTLDIKASYPLHTFVQLEAGVGTRRVNDAEEKTQTHFYGGVRLGPADMRLPKR